LPWCAIEKGFGSALALFVARIGAHDTDDALAADHAAGLAKTFDRSTNLHGYRWRKEIARYGASRNA